MKNQLGKKERVMDKEYIIEEVSNFVSTHEVIVSNTMKKRDINVNFTTFGSRAAVKAIYEIVSSLEPKVQEEVIEMMKNKKIVNE